MPVSQAAQSTRPTKPALTSAWRREHAGSGLTSRLILEYVEREAGRQAVREMLEAAGLSRDERRLRDENHWFSYDVKLALWKAAEQVLGDERAAEHAGACVLEISVAMGLKRTLRALGTPAFVYGNVARANGKFNWAHELEVTGAGSDWVRMRYTDLAGVGYHRYDCEYTRGLLSTVPELFGLPRAQVEHSKCGALGAPCCEFEVRFTAGTQGFKRAALLVGAGAGALALAGALAEPALLAASGALLLVGEAGVAARAMRFLHRRVGLLEGRVREQDDAAQRLLSSLRDLSSDLRLDEVLDQITARAQTAVGGKEFTLLLAEDGRMRADRHSGIPAESLAALESWALAHRGRLLDGATVVVDDLAADDALAELPREQGKPLGSLCAAPLLFRDELLGVLVALAHGSTVFLPGDSEALSAYGAHAAIALSNARLVDRLERQAAQDPLTGLANQRAFNRACAAEFSRAQRSGGEVSVLMLDLDEFKPINDLHGHPFGDQVLIAVADALRASVRHHDTVARMGGEEFAILLPDANAHVARLIAERARGAIARISLPHAALSCSAGAATRSDARPAPMDVLDAADKALYEAKRLGRDRTVVARGEPSSSAV